MQQEAISEIESARPAYIVYVRDWMILPHSDRSILRWADHYLKQSYELIGVMRERDGFQLRSEAEIAQTPGDLNGALFVFRRKAY